MKRKDTIRFVVLPLLPLRHRAKSCISDLNADLVQFSCFDSHHFEGLADLRFIISAKLGRKISEIHFIQSHIKGTTKTDIRPKERHLLEFSLSSSTLLHFSNPLGSPFSTPSASPFSFPAPGICRSYHQPSSPGVTSVAQLFAERIETLRELHVLRLRA